MTGRLDRGSAEVGIDSGIGSDILCGFSLYGRRCQLSSMVDNLTRLGRALFAVPSLLRQQYGEVDTSKCLAHEESIIFDFPCQFGQVMAAFHSLVYVSPTVFYARPKVSAIGTVPDKFCFA